MSLTLDDNSAEFQIRGYKPGHIQINDRIYTRSVIVTPHRLITDWHPQLLTELVPNDFEIIYELKPTIFILGTGTHLTFPPLACYGHLMNVGISVEIMDTHAACRTYTILASEGRSVAAGLIIH